MNPPDRSVMTFLDALQAYVDERVKTVTAPPELRESRERAAHSAKQSLEIALRAVLHAAAHNDVSRVPVLPKRPPSSDKQAAVRPPSDAPATAPDDARPPPTHTETSPDPFPRSRPPLELSIADDDEPSVGDAPPTPRSGA